jgi:hypothetical protein
LRPRGLFLFSSAIRDPCININRRELLLLLAESAARACFVHPAAALVCVNFGKMTNQLSSSGKNWCRSLWKNERFFHARVPTFIFDQACATRCVADLHLSRKNFELRRGNIVEYNFPVSDKMMAVQEPFQWMFFFSRL